MAKSRRYDAGRFSFVEIDKKSRTVQVSFIEEGTGGVARLRIEQPARIAGVGTFRPEVDLKREREAYISPVNGTTNFVNLVEKK